MADERSEKAKKLVEDMKKKKSTKSITMDRSDISDLPVQTQVQVPKKEEPKPVVKEEPKVIVTNKVFVPVKPWEELAERFDPVFEKSTFMNNVKKNQYWGRKAEFMEWHKAYWEKNKANTLRGKGKK